LKEEEFVEIATNEVRTSAYRIILKDIEAGKCPNPDHNVSFDAAIKWYQQLDEHGKGHVRAFIRESIHTTMFQFMCLLEGRYKFHECNQIENRKEEDLPGWFLVCTVDGETLESTLVSETDGDEAKYHEYYYHEGDTFLSTDIKHSSDLD
jgi:hypothetical protein